jgi:hypothetical protein
MSESRIRQGDKPRDTAKPPMSNGKMFGGSRWMKAKDAGKRRSLGERCWLKALVAGSR